MKKEENLEKFGNIDVNKYVESLNSFFFGDTNTKINFSFFWTIKDSPQVTLYLHYLINH